MLSGLARWTPASLVVGITLLFLLPRDGLLGIDYGHQLSRFYLGALHFWQNGWAVPHYTARLCAGIPFFADPQSMYYSLPQFLTFLIDPLFATLLTVALFYLLGYAGWLRLMRELAFSERIAHLGALMFVTNGFVFAHLLVGHVTHHSYLLLPWVLYFVVAPATRRRLVALALVFIYLVFSGSAHVLAVFATTLVLFAPIFFRGKGKFCAIAAALVLAGTVGKLAAVVAYSPRFVVRPLHAPSEWSVPFILRYFWFVPSHTPDVVPYGTMGMGIWEFVGFVTKLSVVLLPIGIVIATLRHRRTALLYLGLVPLVLAVCVGRAGETFAAYHNPVKLLGAFIPAIIVLSAVAMRRIAVYFTSPRARELAFALVALILVGEFAGYADNLARRRVFYGPSYSARIYADLKRGDVARPVTRVISASHHDVAGIAMGASSIRCNEPLFGYGLEGFFSKAHPGAVAAVENGALNFNHPGCLIYPRYFGCRAWDRVPVDEAERLNHLLAGKTAWGVPPWQSILLAIDAATIFGLLAYALFGLTGATRCEYRISSRSIAYRRRSRSSGR